MALLLVLLSIGVQLAAHLTGRDQVSRLVPLFNLDAEQNTPTFFSTFLLLFAALLLAVITALRRNQRASHIFQWSLLTVGFLLMALDEAAALHEALIEPTRKLLGDGNLGVFYFAWIIPGIALVLILAPFFFPGFLLHLPSKTRTAFLMAATLYVGGIFSFELIGGHYVELHGSNNLTYRLMATAEEGFELAGVIVFIWALLVYIADNHKEVRFRLDGVRGE